VLGVEQFVEQNTSAQEHTRGVFQKAGLINHQINPKLWVD